jgi:integrase
VRYLESDEIGRLLAASPTPRHRLAVELAISTGVRLGELPGLRWQDVDFAAGLIRITGQINKGVRVEHAKTDAGYREIVLMDGLANRLKAHKLTSKFSGPGDYVICSEMGTAMNPRNVAQRGLEKAAEKAALADVTFHVLRHTCASVLIFQGHDVTYVAAQLGHEKPLVTLDTYSHLFGRVRNAAKHRAALNAEFGHLFSAG